MHQDRGPAIDATQRAYDPVEGRMSTYPTVVTAVVANAEVIDGVAVDVPFPNYPSDEVAYLTMTASDSDTARESARQRVIDVLHYYKNRLSYRKRTERALAIARRRAAEGRFPQAPYALDNGVLSLPLTQFIAPHGKHGVSELERSRLVQWQGQGWRGARVDAALCQQHPESCRALTVTPRNSEEKTVGVFTKARKRQRTEAFKAQYKQRAGMDGTISQGVRAVGVRRARYWGQATPGWPHIAIAAAMNRERLGAWFAGCKLGKTRKSAFARARAPLAACA